MSWNVHARLDAHCRAGRKEGLLALFPYFAWAEQGSGASRGRMCVCVCDNHSSKLTLLLPPTPSTLSPAGSHNTLENVEFKWMNRTLTFLFKMFQALFGPSASRGGGGMLFYTGCPNGGRPGCIYVLFLPSINYGCKPILTSWGIHIFKPDHEIEVLLVDGAKRLLPLWKPPWKSCKCSMMVKEMGGGPSSWLASDLGQVNNNGAIQADPRVSSAYEKMALGSAAPGFSW